MIFVYIFSITSWLILLIKCLLSTCIYVALTVFSHSHYWYCQPFCRIDYIIPYAWWCEHRDMYTSRSPTRTPTKLAMYICLQFGGDHLFGLKQYLPIQLYPKMRHFNKLLCYYIWTLYYIRTDIIIWTF